MQPGSALKKISATRIIKLGFAPNSYPPGQYVFRVTTTLVINLSPVSTTLAMKLLDKCQPAYTLNERVYSKPIASKQNMEKFSFPKFFSFIAGVVDTGD
jgi:hypothetical protein